MLVAEKINHYVRSCYPAAICDKCISDAMGLTKLAYSAQITAALGTTPSFTRKKGICSLCKNERTVISAKES
jgi:hypothetical protein